MTDPYDVLGVPTDADRDTIRKAYRAKARALHPDLHPDDPDAEAAFKEVASAWEILGDAERRAAHDARQGREAAGALPEEALDAVASAVERAQDWAERGVLPQLTARWRGAGAEAAAWALERQAELSRPGGLPEVGWGARRRARRLASEVQVGLAPWPTGQATALIRRRGGWQVLVDPFALWGAGFRGTDLDDAVMQLLVARYLQVVAVGRVIPPDRPEAWPLVRAAARDRDTAMVRQRWLARLGWGLLAAVLGAMFTAGHQGW